MELTYSMEELLPVWETLTKKYCGFESTSLSYEKAQQLMEAVLYCIREWEGSCLEGNTSPAAGRLPAAEAYARGLKLVIEKTLRMKDLYHNLLPVFDSYGMKCLEDTVYRGIPEFLRWYDVTYDPQNTILTLDYPISSDLSGLSGIDAVYQYVLCICREQQFLRQFPPEEIRLRLSRYAEEYRDLLENIPAIVFSCQPPPSTL